MHKHTKRQRASTTGDRPPRPQRRWSRRWLLGIVLVIALVMAMLFSRTWVGLVVRQRATHLIHAQPFAALSWLEWADDWQASSPANELLKARCYRHLADFPQARHYLDVARDLGLDQSSYDAELNLQRVAAGELLLTEERITELTGNPLYEPQDVGESLARGLLHANRIELCWHVLDAWEADWPNDAEVHAVRGEILSQLRMFVAAERELRQALTQNPAHELALLRLAELQLETHRASGAWELLAEATRDRAPNRGELLLMARCQRLLGQPDQAWELLQRANSDADQNLDAASELGLAALEMGCWDVATQYLSRAYQLSPDDGPHRAMLATCLALQGRNEEAAQHFAALRDARAEATRQQDARLREALKNS